MTAELTTATMPEQATMQANALATLANILVPTNTAQQPYKKRFHVACGTLYLQVAGSVDVAFCVDNAKYNVFLRLGYVPDQELGFFALHDAAMLINSYLQHAWDSLWYSCLLCYPNGSYVPESDGKYEDAVVELAESLIKK